MTEHDWTRFDDLEDRILDELAAVCGEDHASRLDVKRLNRDNDRLYELRVRLCKAGSVTMSGPGPCRSCMSATTPDEVVDAWESGYR